MSDSPPPDAGRSSPPPPLPDRRVEERRAVDRDRVTSRVSLSGEDGELGTVVSIGETRLERATRVALAGRALAGWCAEKVRGLVARNAAADARTARWGGAVGWTGRIVVATLLVAGVGAMIGWCAGWHR